MKNDRICPPTVSEINRACYEARKEICESISEVRFFKSEITWKRQLPPHVSFIGFIGAKKKFKFTSEDLDYNLLIWRDNKWIPAIKTANLYYADQQAQRLIKDGWFGE